MTGVGEPPAGRRYLLVSPCRDEAAYAARTLASVAAQTLRPALWIVVDDGSTDATPELLAAFAQEHSDWVRVLRREDRGARKVGPGVIEAFYAGLEQVPWQEFDYICKLDLDLELPPRYFERLVEEMEADPRLGTVSGKPWFPGEDGELISEAIGDEMSAGMTKFYRSSCFAAIGGFVREVMWDGIDCHRCRMLGWKARSIECDELRFLHLRAMGSSHKGILTGRMRHGFGQWFMGTGLVYMTASALFRATRPPYLVGGLGMWLGYLRSMLRRDARYPDLEFRRFLRRYQWRCLVAGKRDATRDLDAQQASVWHGEGHGGGAG